MTRNPPWPVLAFAVLAVAAAVLPLPRGAWIGTPTLILPSVIALAGAGLLILRRRESWTMAGVAMASTVIGALAPLEAVRLLGEGVGVAAPGLWLFVLGAGVSFLARDGAALGAVRKGGRRTGALVGADRPGRLRRLGALSLADRRRRVRHSPGAAAGAQRHRRGPRRVAGTAAGRFPPDLHQVGACPASRSAARAGSSSPCWSIGCRFCSAGCSRSAVWSARSPSSASLPSW